MPLCNCAVTLVLSALVTHPSIALCQITLSDHIVRARCQSTLSEHVVGARDNENFNGLEEDNCALIGTCEIDLQPEEGEYNETG